MPRRPTAGGVWALPWNFNAGLLYYRADLLAKHPRGPPETFEGARPSRSTAFGAGGAGSVARRLRVAGQTNEGLSSSTCWRCSGRTAPGSWAMTTPRGSPSGARRRRAGGSFAASSSSGVSPVLGRPRPMRSSLAARVWRRPRDLPAQLAVRDGSVRAARAPRSGARWRSPPGPGSRARRAGRRLDRGRTPRPCRTRSRHPDLAVALARHPHQRSLRSARSSIGAALSSDAPGALPRPGVSWRGHPAMSAAADTRAGRTPTPGHAVLPAAVGDGAAGVLGRARRRESGPSGRSPTRGKRLNFFLQAIR